MADQLDIDAMIQRFRDRARAIRDRPLPPIAGAERQAFIQQAEADYMDFAMMADAVASLEDGVLVLRIDLRPKPESGAP
jgi:limonene-1,2-epoxide hydrolase